MRECPMCGGRASFENENGMEENYCCVDCGYCFTEVKKDRDKGEDNND